MLANYKRCAVGLLISGLLVIRPTLGSDKISNYLYQIAITPEINLWKLVVK
jgi:hypothetical protein